MTGTEDAQQQTDRLHAEEEAEKALAEAAPPGDAKDKHRMKGERLSDEAWAIEEANDVVVRPSGLWPEHDNRKE